MYTLLTVLFIGLKLTGYIDWSWWLVCLPVIIEFVVGLLGFAITALFSRKF